MKVTISPGGIVGTVDAPSSKSMTQRAYAAALLHNGTTIINNPGGSDDERAAANIVQQLGAELALKRGNSVAITSRGVHPLSSRIDCGESGLAARLFTPIAGLSEKQLTIDGCGSLLHRPMEMVGSVLPQLNVALNDFTGFLPLTIQGPMAARSLVLDASGGSQLLSGLLFALSGCATEAITIEVHNLKSKPYIDLTLSVLAQFGKPINHNNYRQFYIDPALFTPSPEVTINVEGDWSSAAFMLVAGAIAGEVTVRNLQAASAQADRAILDILSNVGAHIVATSESITAKRARLTAFEFDATDCPDLFPVLAILGACCRGESQIRGVHRLFYKESNRVESITEMLHDFAVPFSVEDDTLFITGVDDLQGTVIDSYKDHRIVMAAAIGALRANGPVDITYPGAANKSYPAFFEDLTLCGVKHITA